PHVEAEDQLSTLQSCIYRSAKSPGALLLDLTKIRSEHTDFQSLQIVLEQHPEIDGCQFLSDGPRRYSELYIRPKDNTINTAVIFKTKEIRVLPRRSGDGDYTITTISLTHLPFVHSEEIGKGSEQSLAPFGKILDVGITTEPKLGI
ncbi:uncharacterized protein B0P05DRAFT_465462, partial [Gilbertella persicaria]|uniref:uncharacterized protein n=1 Tax=Gilbertella persicaria TaxID=101096 RepID=UPI00221EFF29